jgi:hypothetical protein
VSFWEPCSVKYPALTGGVFRPDFIKAMSFFFLYKTSNLPDQYFLNRDRKERYLERLSEKGEKIQGYWGWVIFNIDSFLPYFIMVMNPR